jgi:hypothetical protein
VDYCAVSAPPKSPKNSKKPPTGVETDLCATLYKYVKSLVSKSTDKMENWRNIAEWLEDAGYKTQSSAKFPVKDLLPEKSIVNISNISIEKNQIVIVFKVEIPTSPDSELPIQNLYLDDNNSN